MTKAEQKRQAEAKKLKPQLLKTADMLNDYYSAHCTVMRENGEEHKIRDRDDARLLMAERLRLFASYL